MSAVDLARRDRVFYTTMSIIALLVVIAGFSPSFFLAAINPEAKPLAPIYHVHGAFFTFFMLFYISQNLLIARGRVATHKRMGQIGAVLGFILIIFAFVITIHAGRHGLNGPLSALPDPKQALAVPFFDMFVFGPLFIGALVYRDQPQVHKRLMLLAVLGGLLGAAIGRAPFFIGELQRQLYLYLALILAGPVYDLFTRKRIHPAYLIGLIPCLLLLTKMRLAIGATDGWHRFITMLTG
jgi:hypothetical protein